MYVTYLFYHGYVCSCVSWPGQKGSVAIVCLFTQQEIPLPLHPLITPAAKQILLLTHTDTKCHCPSVYKQHCWDKQLYYWDDLDSLVFLHVFLSRAPLFFIYILLTLPLLLFFFFFLFFSAFIFVTCECGALRLPVGLCLSMSKWHMFNTLYDVSQRVKVCVCVCECQKPAVQFCKTWKNWFPLAAISRWWLVVQWRVTGFHHSVNKMNTPTDTIPNCEAFSTSHTRIASLNDLWTLKLDWRNNKGAFNLDCLKSFYLHSLCILHPYYLWA